MPKRFIMTLISMLLIVTMLPLDAIALVISTDTEFKNGEQAYMLKVCGMDGGAFAFEPGTRIVSSTNARTVQDWAEKLQDGQAAGLRTLYKETLDNCNELRMLPAQSANDLYAIDTVETLVVKYLDELEPVNNWLSWCVDKLDYNRQRVEFLIRDYNAGGKNDADKARIVRDCRNLTEEVVSIIAEISAKQQGVEKTLADLDASSQIALCGNADDRITKDANTEQLIAFDKRVDEMTNHMDDHMVNAIAKEEEDALKSQGKDFDIQVLATDEWGAFICDAATKKALPGVKVIATSMDKTIRKEYTSDSEGKAVIKYTDFKPQGMYAYASLEFFIAGYRLFAVDRIKMLSASGQRFYLSKDDGSAYIISASFDNMEFSQIKNTYYISDLNDIDHTIAMRINTKGKRLKVQLNYDWLYNIAESGYIQGNDVKVEFKDKWLRGAKIKAGTQNPLVYLYRGSMDYDTYTIPASFVQTDIKKPVVGKSNAMSFSPGAALGIPSDILKLGSLDFSLDLPIPEVQIMADVGGRFYMAVGDKLKDLEGENKDNQWKSRSQKEQDAKIDELQKEKGMTKIQAQRKVMRDNSASRKTKFLGDGSINVNFYGAGMGTINYDTGRVTLNAGGAVSLVGKISFTWQFYIPTPFFTIPAFFALDFSVSAMFYENFGVAFDYPSFKNFEIHDGTGFTIGLLVTIGATLGIGHAKICNLYGRIYGMAGITMFIGGKKNTVKMTLGWGFEIGVQIFIFKAVWKHGPWSKDFEVQASRSGPSMNEYVITKLLNGSDQNAMITYELNENSWNDYPEFNEYMASLSAEPPVVMPGEGTEPARKTEVLSDISLVGQEIQYILVDGTLFGFWITPNCEFTDSSGTKYNTPKLVWVNMSDPSCFGVVDVPNVKECRGANYDISFDVFQYRDPDRSRVLCAITSAPVSKFQDNRILYDTKNGRFSYYALARKGSSLTIVRADSRFVWAASIQEMMEVGYMFTSPSIVVRSDGTDKAQTCYVMYNFTRINDTPIDQSLYVQAAWLDYIPDSAEMRLRGHLSKRSNGTYAWSCDKGGTTLTIHSYDAGNKVLSTMFSAMNNIVDGTKKLVENTTGAVPLFDKNGYLSAGLYLQRGAGDTAKLGCITFEGGTRLKQIDYDIVVGADHFKVSPTMKTGSYYVYWVEQSKGYDIGVQFENVPKYTINCCVFDATEQLFSPVFTLLKTDVEVATADFQMNNNSLSMFCVAPEDSSRFGSMAYVRGKLLRYDFDLKGIVDLVGASPCNPAIGAGMDNDILISVTNPGNLPVSKFGVNVFYYSDTGAKVFLKSFEIDCLQEEKSEVNEYQYNDQGIMTGISSRVNTNHEVYQVPGVGDENDTLFINPVFTEINADGTPGQTSSKPKYLKILMPGYTRMYKFTLEVPANWRGKQKLYVEVSKVMTTPMDSCFFPETRSADGTLLDSAGNVIQEYMLGFDAAAPENVIRSAVSQSGLPLSLGKVEDISPSGAVILTSDPEVSLQSPYNDLWIDVDQYVINGVEYSSVSIGNRSSDDVTPSEPPTLVVMTDGKETFRHQFANNLDGSYSYLIDIPTYQFSKTLKYERMSFTVYNGSDYNEMDENDNTYEIVNARIVPTPTPVPPPVTGDSAVPHVWAALAALSLLLLAALLLKRRPARTKE